MDKIISLLGEAFDLETPDNAALASRANALISAAREEKGTVKNREQFALLKRAVDEVKSIHAALGERAAFADEVAVTHAALDEIELLEESEPIAAAAGSRFVRDVAVPARSRPRSTAHGAGGGYVIVASGNPDHQYRDGDDVADAWNNAWRELQRGSGSAERRIATVDWSSEYGPESPMVRDNASAADNGAALERARSEFVERQRANNALVASGGVSGPAEPQYTVPTFGSAARPIRDALPGLLSRRGEIVYNNAPLISDILVDTGSTNAIGTVTSAQDLAGATKGVMEITAPSQLSAVVEANYMRFSQGNFSDRFLPEWTTAWLKNAQVQFARHNDSRRFNDIATASTHMVDTPAKFGAYRDLRRCLLGITEELEDRFRDPSLPITVLMPEFVPAMLASDLIAQAPGDAAFDITEDRVRALLQGMDPNVNFAFVFDGNQTHQRLLTTPSGQSPRTPGFDADVDFLVFPTGAWAFLDGGTLDLGILRDTVVSATNKFQTFFEGWEAVAQLVPVSYRVTISLCADGASQLPSAVNVCSPQGS